MVLKKVECASGRTVVDDDARRQQDESVELLEYAVPWLVDGEDNGQSLPGQALLRLKSGCIYHNKL